MARNDFFQSMAGIALNFFDAYTAAIFLPADDGPRGVGEQEETCRLAAHLSLGDDVIKNAVIAPGMGIVGWIIRNKKPLLISNFDQKRGRLGYYGPKAEAGIRAFMGCPLEGVPGAICLDSKKTFTFGEKDQKILGQLASLIGAQYRNGRSIETSLLEHSYYQCLRVIGGLRKKHPKWTGFQAALLDLLAEVTGFKHCFLAVRDESGRYYYLEGSNRELFEDAELAPRRFSVGQGVIGWVFKNSAPVYSGDKDSGAATLFGKDVQNGRFKTVICEPIIFSRRTRGALVFADAELKPLGEELKAFTALVAEYLTLFLENLHLKSRLTKSGP